MKTILKSLILIVMICMVYDGNSQIKVDLKKKIGNQTNNRANSKADQAIDKGLDKIEQGVKGVFKKKDAAGDTQEDPGGQSQQAPQRDAGTSPVSEPQPAGQTQTALQSYSKYDFVPGDKVLLY